MIPAARMSADAVIPVISGRAASVRPSFRPSSTVISCVKTRAGSKGTPYSSRVRR